MSGIERNARACSFGKNIPCSPVPSPHAVPGSSGEAVQDMGPVCFLHRPQPPQAHLVLDLRSSWRQKGSTAGQQATLVAPL